MKARRRSRIKMKMGVVKGVILLLALVGAGAGTSLIDFLRSREDLSQVGGSYFS